MIGTTTTVRALITGALLLATAAQAEVYTLDGFGHGSNVVIAVNGQRLGPQPCTFDFAWGKRYTITYVSELKGDRQFRGSTGPILFAAPAAFAALPEPAWVKDVSAARQRYPHYSVRVGKGEAKLLSVALDRARSEARHAMADNAPADPAQDQQAELKDSTVLECHWRKSRKGVYAAYALLGVKDRDAPAAAAPKLPELPAGVPAWFVRPGTCVKEGHKVAFGTQPVTDNTLRGRLFDRAKSRARAEHARMAQAKIQTSHNARGGRSRSMRTSMTLRGAMSLESLVLKEADGAMVLFCAISAPPGSPTKGGHTRFKRRSK